MTPPPCICLEVFVDAVCGRIDPYAWKVEYEHHERDGHVASCHHARVPRAPERSGLRLAPEPRAHRGLTGAFPRSERVYLDGVFCVVLSFIARNWVSVEPEITANAGAVRDVGSLRAGSGLNRRTVAATDPGGGYGRASGELSNAEGSRAALSR